MVGGLMDKPFLLMVAIQPVRIYKQEMRRNLIIVACFFLIYSWKWQNIIMYAYKPFINVSNEISSRKLLTKSFVNSLFRLIERKISNLNINRISISKLKSYSWYEILKQIKQPLRQSIVRSNNERVLRWRLFNSYTNRFLILITVCTDTPVSAAIAR